MTDIEISVKNLNISIRNPPKKGLYRLAFDCWFSYDDHDPRVWCDILNFEVDRKVYFNNIYDCMLTKNESDLIWKINHGAIPTGRCLSSSSVYNPFSDRVGLPPHNTLLSGVIIKSNVAAFFTTGCPS